MASSIVPCILDANIIANTPIEYVRDLVDVSSELLYSFYETFLENHTDDPTDVTAAEKLEAALEKKRDRDKFFEDFKPYVEAFRGLRATDITLALGKEKIDMLFKAYEILDESKFAEAEQAGVTSDQVVKLINHMRDNAHFYPNECETILALAKILEKNKKHFRSITTRTPVYFLLNNPDFELIKRMITNLHNYSDSGLNPKEWRHL